MLHLAVAGSQPLPVGGPPPVIHGGTLAAFQGTSHPVLSLPVGGPPTAQPVIHGGTLAAIHGTTHPVILGTTYPVGTTILVILGSYPVGTTILVIPGTSAVIPGTSAVFPGTSPVFPGTSAVILGTTHLGIISQTPRLVTCVI